MRILFASSDFLPRIGGVSMMVHGLAEACVNLGHEVIVVAPAVDDDESQRELPYLVIRDAKAYPRPLVRLRRIANEHRIARWMYDVIDAHKPDAIIVGVHKIYGQACLSAGKRLSIPVGGLVHGLEVASLLERRASGPLAWIAGGVGYPVAWKQLLKYLLETDALFANSSVTSAYVQRKSGRTPVTVGCGVSEDAVQAMTPHEIANVQRPGFRARLGLAEAPTIGFLGRLVARKNVETILRSLRLLAGARALIVGDGPERERLRALAENLGVGDRAVFTGQVDPDRKWDYLRAIDVFCLPSRNLGGYNFEGFGIAFLEATVAGAPLVGGRSGGIPDVVKHEKTGLLADPDDWQDVARCARRLLEDKRLAAQCVNAAQAQVHEHFNWRVIASGIITELCGSQLRTRAGKRGQS